jgi:ATPase subunit of ABC transporter with duplicated ATPase domains
MMALNTWNGGVIVISHDERFITSVANEVRDAAAVTFVLFRRCAHSSFGYVEMAQLQSSKATWRPTRSVVDPFQLELC